MTDREEELNEQMYKVWIHTLIPLALIIWGVIIWNVVFWVIKFNR